MDYSVDFKIREEEDITQEEAYSLLKTFLKENDNLEGVLQLQLNEAMEGILETERSEEEELSSEFK